MNAHEHALAVADLPPHERDVGPPVDEAVVGGHGEGPVRGGELGRREALDEAVVAQSGA